jgi:hypothetical protein
MMKKRRLDASRILEFSQSLRLIVRAKPKHSPEKEIGECSAKASLDPFCFNSAAVPAALNCGLKDFSSLAQGLLIMFHLL